MPYTVRPAPPTNNLGSAHAGQEWSPLSHIITTHACCHHHSQSVKVLKINVYYLILMLIDSTLATTQVMGVCQVLTIRSYMSDFVQC